MRFLVFEIWSILYSTVLNIEPGTWKKMEPDLANLFQTLNSEIGDSTHTYPGPGNGAPAGERGGQAPTNTGG